MPSKHTVRSGDCIASIAYENGHFWRTVWDDGDNAELKRKRQSPFHLLPGDIVTVPDLRVKQESKPSDQRHQFKRKGVPAVVILAVRRHKTAQEEEAEEASQDPQDEPQNVTLGEADERELEEEAAAEIKYAVVIEGRHSTGTTDSEGKVRLTILPSDREGMLILEPGTPRERTVPLMLGGVDPIDTPSGAAQRLNNLSYGPVPTEPGTTEAELASTIAEFQRANALSPSGRLDAPTRDKLKQIHGS